MANGAGKSGRTVQYCMPYAYEILTAASLPAVTNARASGDYFHSTNNWAIGATSLFYWALNILPFKDGFYSSTNVQRGGQTVGPETNPDREAIIATLSCAMVGPMDGILLLNASRVMTTCRKDGTVLKPDRPLTPPDYCFTLRQPLCKVYHTYSDIAGFGLVHYVFNNDVSPLVSDMVSMKGNEAYAVYNWYTKEVVPFQPRVVLRGGYENHVYAIVTPVLCGWAFLGEVDKYVTVAGLRFPSITCAASRLTAHVAGVTGETVTVCAARASDWATTCNKLSFARDEVQTVTF
jgi:hypothetical protein